ncbi:MAG: hypothetical protein KGZ38_00860 [Erysipelothrix sp.]|nr:hypothetical protein [Erysipelothrix sp.]
MAVKELTSYERLCDLAKKEELTTKEIGEAASVGINKAKELKKEIIQWMTESEKYRVYNTIRIQTKAVFEFLSKDIDEYKGGY